ncbi:MAG: SgcJ/EcaC family oxidoreductase [Bryobacteraceae bacterium]|nr:SgcJ/EcaC family oxidoreductase [Bryobacteraceae bacterium]
MSKLAAFATVLLWSFGLSTTGQTGAVTDDAAVRSAIGVLQSGWNSHDMTLYMSVISSDANFVNVNGWWWQGHYEIKDAHIKAHETAFKASKAEVVAKKIRFLKPDMAVAQAAWKVYGDVRNTAARDYMMTLILRKQNGRWLITDAQNGSVEDRSRSSMTANLTTEATFGGSATTGSRGTASAGESAVRRTLAEVDERCSRGDIIGAARSYAIDADVIDTKANWSRGRDQIEKSLSEFRNDTFKAGRYTSELAKLAFPYPDVVVATTRWRAHAGSESQAVRGMGIVILQRGHDQWSIVASQNTISRGTPPAAH